MWTDDLHSKFVAALFDVGLKMGSPKLVHQMIQPYCGPNDPIPTTEHIKSHLQKYRNTIVKNRGEIVHLFTSAYNSSITKTPMETAMKVRGA